MKKIILILILLSSLALWSKGIKLSSDLDLGFSYNSNIILLSDQDQDEFLDNENSEKYQIDSLDDLIMDLSYSLTMKNYWLGGHTQIQDIKFNFEKYLKNPVKDSGYVSWRIRQYFNRWFDVSFLYRFYPKIYLRKYKSEIDDDYHEFEYSKNYFSAIAEYELQKNLKFKGNLEYSQLFFNQWFTEYDTGIITSNLFLLLNPKKNMQVELRYGYRISNAEADQAYNDFVQFDGIIKDASYESNIYGCNLKFRKFYSNTTLNLGYRLETRFYDSDFADDNYHIQRDDYMHTASVSIYKALDRNISLLIDAELGFRQTDSPYDYVIDDKEFSYWKSGISLSYDFDLK